MNRIQRGACLALSLAVAGCQAAAPGNESAGEGNTADGNAVYSTYGVHNPPEDSPCQSPDCSYAGQPGRPADPSYPPYWQSRWTMYKVSAGYETNPPPYKASPPPARPTKPRRARAITIPPGAGRAAKAR